MIINIAKAIVASLWLVLMAATANAQVAAESENFVFYGDVREKDARKILQDLEAYRENLLFILKAKAKPEFVKVPIYGLKSDKDFDRIVGRSDVGGIYTITDRGPAFLLNVRRGFKRDSRARDIAFHEYAHHLLAAYTTTYWPRWYNEGFAEFVASYEHDGKSQFKLGEPYGHHAYFLTSKTWIPPEVMLRSVHRYPFGQDAGPMQRMFYAQSWLMVHFLNNDSRMDGAFPRYMAKLQKDGDPVEILEGTMGMTPDALEAALREYYDANQYMVQTFDAASHPEQHEVAATEIDKATLLAHMADAAVLFADVEADFERADEAIARALDKGGATAQLHAIQGRLAYKRDDFEAARTHLEAAIAAEPDRLDALRSLGRLEIESKTRFGTGDREAGRAHLLKVLDANPNDPDAAYQYVMSYRSQFDSLPQSALRPAQVSLNYYRRPRFAGRTLQVANMLINSGETSDLVRHLKPIAEWGPSPNARNAAKEMMKLTGTSPSP